MILQELQDRKLIHPPKWLITNTCYLTLMGSQAYGVSHDSSDQDIYGICIPNKEEIFPHLRGDIEGFGRQKKRFEQWSEHHIKDGDALGGKGREYDFTVMNIVKYFNLLMENNPNIIDCIYTPVNCILHITTVGQMIRDNRKLFIHKGLYHKFRGYAYSQLHRINDKAVGKRKELVEKHGYDTKFAYHVVRLISEAEQLMIHGDMDIQLDNERLKAIRRGEWTLQQIRDFFNEKERQLERLYETSPLPYAPDEPRIKALLLQCLEHHYGSLDKCINTLDKYEVAYREIKSIIERLS